MSKAIKTLLIVAACFVLGGIVITTACVGVARASGVSFSNQMWEQRYADRTYTNTGAQSQELSNVRSLELLLVGEPVTIKSSARQDTVTIEWSQSYDNQYALTESASGHVTFRRDESNSMINGLSFGPDGFRFYYDGWLQFLDGLFWWDIRWNERHDFYNDAGSSRPVTVTVPEGMDLGDISIAIVSSTVDFDGISAAKITYAGVDTRLDLRDCRADSLYVGNVSGRVTLADCEIGFVEMATVSGRLDVSDGDCERLEIAGVNATLNVGGTAGLRRASVSGVNAQADLRLPGSRDDYDISAEGLNASLTVDGQHYGRRNLTGRAGAGKLEAAGLNAELRVRFEGD